MLRNRREQIGGYNAMKREIAFAAALVGALVLPLCSCGMGGIEGKGTRTEAQCKSNGFAERGREVIPFSRPL